MKKALILALGLGLGLGLTLNAADKAAGGGKTTRTPEQRQLMKEMIQKYDTNGDKKLDKDERAKMSAEDKEKLAKAGLGGGQRKKN